MANTDTAGKPSDDAGDGEQAEIAHIEAILHPFVVGARAITPRPDPRRLLGPFLREMWHGLAEQDQRLILWHSVATTLTHLCQRGADHE